VILSISNDSYAILLLCSDLAIKALEDEIKPYTAAQWSRLAERLSANSLTPASLFDVNSDHIKKALFLADEEINRINRLLSRSGQLSIVLAALGDKGIQVLTRADHNYPVSMRSKLKRLAPPVLYYAGNLALLKNRGVSVVGSRNIDEAALRFTEKLAKRCTDDGMNIVSGGARGVDSVAESTAIRSDGTTIIVVADSMEKKIQSKETRNAIMKNQSLIFSATRPDMPFRTFAAMERNKYIYALADFVVVVSSDYNKGGTWAGAVENLRNNWVPMFVRKADDVPEGNIQLLKNKGVHALSEQVFSESMNLFDWFHNCSMSSNTAPEPVRQLSFFD
jgi:predicted Rossmann fold nucleotide-binding protein DprA/Smf involved in DNA uptake